MFQCVAECSFVRVPVLAGNTPSAKASLNYDGRQQRTGIRKLQLSRATREWIRIMSIKLMSYVWDNSPHSNGTLLIHLALADFANDSGLCYPSIATLARKSRMTERNVQYALQTLQETGDLEIQDCSGPRGCNLFFLRGGENFAGGVKPISPGVKKKTGGGETHFTRSVIDPSCSRAHIGGFAESPDWAEVEIFADKIGLAKWKARDWFLEMEGCGWLDYQHRPVTKWQAVLTRVKVKWETDGRPAAPPTARGYGSNTGAKAPSWAELKCRLEAVEKRLQELRNKGSQTATGTIYPPGILEEIKKLRTTRAELLRKLTSE